MNNTQAFRIGIVGGMGPLAGVRLQELIITCTPAGTDQEHLQVLCFTNPQIPDRTESWKTQEATAACIEAIRETATILVSAGADRLVMPCHTAHVHINEIQHGIPVPFVNMVELTLQKIRAIARPEDRIAFLGSDGSRNAGLYHERARDIAWILPSEDDQRTIMRAIYTIKAGRQEEGCDLLLTVAARLREMGATYVLLGCTELSLCASQLRAQNIPCIDPLELVAKECVSNAGALM